MKFRPQKEVLVVSKSVAPLPSARERAKGRSSNLSSGPPGRPDRGPNDDHRPYQSVSLPLFPARKWFLTAKCRDAEAEWSPRWMCSWRNPACI